jgi:hypothetical protein
MDFYFKKEFLRRVAPFCIKILSDRRNEREKFSSLSRVRAWIRAWAALLIRAIRLRLSSDLGLTMGGLELDQHLLEARIGSNITPRRIKK